MKNTTMNGNNILNTKDRTIVLTIFTGTYFFAAFAVLGFAPLLPFIHEGLLLSNTSFGLFISILYLDALIPGILAGLISEPRRLRLGSSLAIRLP